MNGFSGVKSWLSSFCVRAAPSRSVFQSMRRRAGEKTKTARPRERRGILPRQARRRAIRFVDGSSLSREAGKKYKKSRPAAP
jgi:hypothetical protein